jgi:hypothetical protein
MFLNFGIEGWKGPTLHPFTNLDIGTRRP